MSPQAHPSDDQLDAVTWCGHLIPAGSVYAFLADHRHELFPPELFADVARQDGGQPSVPAEVVATVMVLQALEGLSDREAVSALRRDIAWKVACGLRLDDEGFHPTGRVYWRNRLRASGRPRRVFDAVRQVVEQTGVLKGRGRRVLDSTVLADAVATQDTITQLVGAIRRVRRLVPAAREVELGAHDYDRPGKPVCVWDDPQAKQALVSGLVNDALALLGVVNDVELDGEPAEAVALLALVAGQDVEPGDQPGSSCWPTGRRGWRCWVTPTTAPGRPAQPCALPATCRRSSRSRWPVRSRWVHHPRLPHRPPGRDGQVPGRFHRHDHRVRAGQLRPLVPGLPTAPALHHRQAWPHPPHPPARA